MGRPAAKRGDRVVATDTHIVLLGRKHVPTPRPHPFDGVLDGGLSPDVKIEGRPAAVKGSTATNTPAHVPQGGPFQRPPSNRATVTVGSDTVKINGKPAARHADVAVTCNDPADLPVGKVVARSTVRIG